MIKALFKFTDLSGTDAVVIDTTSSFGGFRELSPFILPAPPAKNLENLWQFSKVYPRQVDKNGEPTEEWNRWHLQGWNDTKAHRYPMGKAKPLYSYWYGEHLNYIQARKRIYIPEYAKNVVGTLSFQKLKGLYNGDHDIILLDYDAYDHQALGMSLVDVANNERRKMGHAFVLLMVLNDMIEECCVQTSNK